MKKSGSMARRLAFLFALSTLILAQSCKNPTIRSEEEFQKAKYGFQYLLYPDSYESLQVQTAEAFLDYGGTNVDAAWTNPYTFFPKATGNFLVRVSTMNRGSYAIRLQEAGPDRADSGNMAERQPGRGTGQMVFLRLGPGYDPFDILG
jgi:hypothetical protein